MILIAKRHSNIFKKVLVDVEKKGVEMRIENGYKIIHDTSFHDQSNDYKIMIDGEYERNHSMLLKSLTKKLVEFISDLVKAHPRKFRLIFDFNLLDKDDNIVNLRHLISTKQVTVRSVDQVRNYVRTALIELESIIDKKGFEKSGLRFGSGLYMLVNERKDIGAFGGTYIPLPERVLAKRCCVNPDNSKTGDNMCFK